MKSQVSFKFDGSHNKKPIISILKKDIPNFKYEIEKESRNVYRIYVAGSCAELKTFRKCIKIQCFSILDSSREI